MAWENRRVWTYALKEGCRISLWVTGLIVIMRQLKFSGGGPSFSRSGLLVHAGAELKFAVKVYVLIAVLTMFYERWAVWKNNQVKGR